jgi:L-iditol 2-dehydrogenase
VPCGDCHFCRHRAFAQCATYKRTGITAGFEPAGGGYAEYVRVMPFVLPGVVRIPARNNFEEGAMLEPVNTVLKAVRRLSLLPGDVVLVAGQGPIGLMFTRLLQIEGAQVLATDLLDERLRLARKFGAKWTLAVNGKSEIRKLLLVAAPPESADSHPSPHSLKAPACPASTVQPSNNSAIQRLVRRVTKGRGLDAAVIAVPSDSVARESQALLRGGGQLLLFAHTKRGDSLALDPAAICVDEKDLLGSYSSDVTLQGEVARIVFSRRLDVRPLITHRFSLAETAAAVALAARPTADSLKIVVTQPV